MKRLAAILAAVLLLVSVAGTATAAGPTVGRADTAQAKSTKGPMTKAATTLASTVEYNPWGCTTYTENPHQSGHYPGTVAALAEHRCTGYYGANRSIRTYPTYQTLEAWLYFEHCDWVIFCGWVQRDHWNSGQVSSSVTIRPGHVMAGNCVNDVSVRWRVLAYGSSYGFDGSAYKTYTSQDEKIVTLACGG